MSSGDESDEFDDVLAAANTKTQNAHVERLDVPRFEGVHLGLFATGRSFFGKAVDDLEKIQKRFGCLDAKPKSFAFVTSTSTKDSATLAN